MRSLTGHTDNLDLLRSLAVFFVLLDHTLEFHGFTYGGPFEMHQLGLLGVLFFFVHTCFVLMLSLERQSLFVSGWELVKSFYIRRVFRIYPLAIFFLCLMTLFKIPSTHLSPHFITYEPPSAGKFLANVLLIQNLTHHHRGSIIGQYWSLPLEVQMYIVLPLLFFASRFLKKTGAQLALWASISIFFAYLQGTVLHVQIMEYVPNFMGGIMAFTLFARSKPRSSAAGWLPFLVLLSLIYMMWPARLTGWIICSLLGFSIPFFREISSERLKSLVKTVSKYSYGIYISHFFSLWVAFMKLAAAPALIQWGIYAGLLAALPWALYHVVEKPGIQLGIRLAEQTEKNKNVPLPPRLMTRVLSGGSAHADSSPV